jgi:uncharacterized protein (DUF2336 family)
MGAAVSVIPELEDVIQYGSHEKRASTLRRITSLFLDGADYYTDEHILLFDDVFVRLIEEIETRARAELANCLAPVRNAPMQVLRTLANDDDISVAGPVLTQTPRLTDFDLVEVANVKGQAHLQAIAIRPAIGEALTDVLVRRGDSTVAHCVADNRGARISELSFSNLIKRAEQDGALAEKVGLRPDIPAPLFRELVMQATEVVLRRLLASAEPETRAEIRRVLARVSDEVGARANARDFSAAKRAVLGLHRAGKMTETTLLEFCRDGKYEEAVVALSSLCKVPVDVSERLMSGDRHDPVLILCKAAGFDWETVKALIGMRPGAKGGGPNLDAACGNFERLSPSTAQRVVRFWQIRPDLKYATA